MGSSSDLESLKTALGDDADGWTDHALGPFIISTDGNIAQAAAAFRKSRLLAASTPSYPSEKWPNFIELRHSFVVTPTAACSFSRT